eukprot:scaffold46171_cov29-Tisochrysis_lutea.AAC.1
MGGKVSKAVGVNRARIFHSCKKHTAATRGTWHRAGAFRWAVAQHHGIRSGLTTIALVPSRRQGRPAGVRATPLIEVGESGF